MNIVDAAAAHAAPIIRTDGRAIVLDLSTGSRLCGEAVAGLGCEALGRLIDASMAAAGTGYAFGRYAEPRELYDNEHFAGAGERRSVHLGIDLFCAAGTPVHAPFAGSVELVANNARELDYGPMVVLRHRTDAGEPFFTLFGHLDARVLDTLEPGQEIAAGRQIASVGAPPQNGNWPPHLHVQAILDLLDLGADFPGVAAPSEQEYWRSVSPSPAALFPECERTRLEYAQCS